MICLAQLGVIFLRRKSDIAPCGRSDILFAFVASNARSAYHCRRQYHARSAYHSPKANRVGAPALWQMRRGPLSIHLFIEAIAADELADDACRRYLVVDVCLEDVVEHLNHGSDLVVALVGGVDRGEQGIDVLLDYAQLI